MAQPPRCFFPVYAAHRRTAPTLAMPPTLPWHSCIVRGLPAGRPRPPMPPCPAPPQTKSKMRPVLQQGACIEFCISPSGSNQNKKQQDDGICSTMVGFRAAAPSNTGAGGEKGGCSVGRGGQRACRANERVGAPRHPGRAPLVDACRARCGCVRRGGRGRLPNGRGTACSPGRRGVARATMSEMPSEARCSACRSSWCRRARAV